MRPVFADLVAEIQRSIGFYSSTHRDIELTRVLGLGNAFRLPGLKKYLENNLTIPGGVQTLSKFNRLVPSATINAPNFTDNVLSFSSAYGLAIQGLEMASISANLLPTELARVALWNKKRPWFGAAAAALAMSAGLIWARYSMDQTALAAGRDVRSETSRIIAEARQKQQDYREVSTDTGAKEEQIKQYLELQDESTLVPGILSLAHAIVPDPGPEIRGATTAEALKKLIESDPEKYARTNRKQMYVESFEMTYSPNIPEMARPASALSNTPGGRTTITEPSRGRGGGMVGPGGGNPRFGGRMPGYVEEPMSGGGGSGDESEGDPTTRGFLVTMTGKLLYGKDNAAAQRLFESEIEPLLAQLGTKKGLGFHVLAEDPKRDDKKNIVVQVVPYYQNAKNPFGQVLGGANDPNQADLYKDPLTDENMTTDWKFAISFKVQVGDAPEPEEGEQSTEDSNG
jgi:hypothetical protein